MSFRNLLYSYGILETHSINIPVVSIGNITLGGTGKTPFVRYLAEKIISMGYHPGIISRGYGRKSKSQIIVHDGIKMVSTWIDSGDEPFLLGSWLVSVPIVVDNNRMAAARTLIRKFKIDIIILDDGFQHRKIHRDLDILLFNSLEKKKSLYMFPFGRLREKLHNISRSDILIFTKSQNIELNEMKKYFDVALPEKVFFCSNKFKIIKFNDKAILDCSVLNSPSLAFCGIGDPSSFKLGFRSLGVKINYYEILNDHEQYSVNTLKLLLKLVKNLKIKSVVTTEKDVLKLPSWFINEINLFILQMEFVFPQHQEGFLMESVKKVLL